jgi:hypothetical protein
LLLDGGFEFGFFLLDGGIGRRCRGGLAIPGCRRHCRRLGGAELIGSRRKIVLKL